jgi:ComEC/Rec2-related protein
VTASALICAAVALLLAGVIFLVPERAGRQWALLLGQGLAPAATVALVLLATGGSLARAAEGPVDEAIASSATFTAYLRIVGEPSSLPQGAFGGGERFLVDAEVIGGLLGGTPFISATPVVVLGSASWSTMGTGDTVRVLGIAKPSDRPGRATAIFLPSSRPMVQEAEGWFGYTDGLRSRFRDAAQRDGRDHGLLPGMVLGDRTTLEPDLEHAMKTTGLTHLTAVSGANCSYVIAFMFLGLRFGRVPRFPAAIGAVMALAGFVLLVRPEPSVLRAAVMGGIGVVAVLSGRGKVSLTLLMLSIIVLLAVDPWLSVSFAFMLSVAATLGLVLAGPAVAESLGRLMPRVMAQVLAIPLTAQLFCAPILVLIQPALPVYSLPANVAVSPVVPAITLLGMVAILALVAAPVLAQPLIVAAQGGTRWVGAVADTFAGAPAASLPWASGPAGATLAALVSLAVLFLLVARRPQSTRWNHMLGATGSGGDPVRSRERVNRSPADHTAFVQGGPPGTGRTRPPSADNGGMARGRRVLVMGLILTVVAAAVIVLVKVTTVPPATGWIVAVCDVGQGDGLVVGTAPGHALVVDTGPDPAAMDRCLDDLSVEVIDALVITHLHDDHYGGVEGAVNGRTVSKFYYSTGEDRLPREVTDAAADAGVRPEKLDSLTTFDLQRTQVRVLWPAGSAEAEEENNASAVLDVVVQASDRPVRILLTGDLEEDAGARMLDASPEIANRGVDILKVAHHGARNGGTTLIEALRPRLALISVGEDNEYGHPHPTILEALVRADIPVVRTDELGSFTVNVVGTTMEVRDLE